MCRGEDRAQRKSTEKREKAEIRDCWKCAVPYFYAVVSNSVRRKGTVQKPLSVKVLNSYEESSQMQQAAEVWYLAVFRSETERFIRNLQ